MTPVAMSSAAEISRKIRLLLAPAALFKLLRLFLHLPLSTFAMIRLSARAKRDRKIIVVVVLINQLGDIVAAEPAARYAAKIGGGKIVWLIGAPYASIVRRQPYVEDAIPILCVSEWIIMRWLYNHLPGIRQCVLHIDGHPCPWFGLRVHNSTAFNITMETYYLQGGLLSAFSRQGLGIELDERPQLDVWPVDLDHCLVNQPELAAFLRQPVAVVHFVSNEVERSLTHQQAETCAEWLRSRGYSILEVGFTPMLPPATDCICLRSDLPLPWQFAAVSHGQIFVGVDSAFSHVANAFAIPSVVLIGRYTHYVDHIPYSGPWRRQIGVHLIRSTEPIKAIGRNEILDGLERAFPLQQHAAPIEQPSGLNS